MGLSQALILGGACFLAGIVTGYLVTARTCRQMLRNYEDYIAEYRRMLGRSGAEDALRREVVD
jgi:uncharacterized protein YneF (UPF0154 family)